MIINLVFLFLLLSYSIDLVSSLQQGGHGILYYNGVILAIAICMFAAYTLTSMWLAIVAMKNGARVPWGAILLDPTIGFIGFRLARRDGVEVLVSALKSLETDSRAFDRAFWRVDRR